MNTMLSLWNCDNFEAALLSVTLLQKIGAKRIIVRANNGTA